MKKKSSLILLLVISLSFPVFTFAETIVPKSGKTVEGASRTESEDYDGKQQFISLLKELSNLLSDFGEKWSDPQNKVKIELQSRKIISELQDFITGHPNSRYVDDAEYILIQITPPDNEIISTSRLNKFSDKYPNAALEKETLDNASFLVFEKETKLVNVIKFDIMENLYFKKDYSASAKIARENIDNLNKENLTVKGYRFLSLNYTFLMRNYESLGDKESVKAVCKEAIEKIPDRKSKESFVKKLKEYLK